MTEHAKGPAVGVGAIVIRDGRVLLVRRANEPAAGCWSVPGGRVRWGETLEEAVRREVIEETRICVTVERLAGVSEFVWPPEPPYDFHYVLLDYFCTFESGDCVCGDDALEAGWFRLDEVATLDTTPGLMEKLLGWLGMPGG